MEEAHRESQIVYNQAYLQNGYQNYPINALNPTMLAEMARIQGNATQTQIAYAQQGVVDYSQESLSNKKLSEIKDILKSQGKKVTGNKEDLIARILGIEEPTVAAAARSSKHGYDSGDEDSVSKKKMRGEKDDIVLSQCFLCHVTNDLVKYKDVKICNTCKSAWKGKRLLKDQACQMFSLQPEDLSKLPHKEQAGSTAGSTQTVPLYAFATVAGAAVKKYGGLFYMVKDNQIHRDHIAQVIQTQRQQQQQYMMQQYPFQSPDEFFKVQQQLQEHLMNQQVSVDSLEHQQQQQQQQQQQHNNNYDENYANNQSDQNLQGQNVQESLEENEQS